jgi:hypothetical protein
MHEIFWNVENGWLGSDEEYSVTTYHRLKHWAIIIASFIQEPILLKEWKLNQWYQSKHKVIPAL